MLWWSDSHQRRWADRVQKHFGQQSVACFPANVANYQGEVVQLTLILCEKYSTVMEKGFLRLV